MFQLRQVAQLLFSLLCLFNGQLLATERTVSIHHPNAQDAGVGSNKMPFKTLSYAMSQLNPGDHLTIEAGIYRDALVFPVNQWSRIDAKLIASGEMHGLKLPKMAQTTIEGKGGVLIKGSDLVRDWRAMGGGRFVKVWHDETQQVFIDGQALSQVGGTIFGGFPTLMNHPLATLHQSQKGIWPGRVRGDQNAMPANSFYYDHVGKALYLQTDFKTLDQHEVEVSVRPHLLNGNGVTDITVKNISFQHANTSTKFRSGLISMTGMHLTLDNLHVSLADSIGIVLIGDDITLQNSSANDCGQLGLLARGNRMQLLHNKTNDNNTRGFNKWWEAGGAKFVGNGGLQNSTLSHHQALGNGGDGIWFDWKNRNNTIEHALTAYNTGFGIHYEASDQGRIVNNVVIANQQRGIYLSHASESVVAFNLVAGNQMQGIAVIDEGRRDPTVGFDFSANNNQLFANVIAWNASAIVLPSQKANNRSDHNVLIGDQTQTYAGLGWLNMFMVTLKEWTQRTKQDSHSQHINIPINEAFKQSIMAKTTPNLDWYQAIRRDLKPVKLEARLEKPLEGATDLRAGASISPALLNKKVPTK